MEERERLGGMEGRETGWDVMYERSIKVINKQTNKETNLKNC